jgi:hypothetical protein
VTDARRAAIAAVAAGFAWLALVPASQLFREDELSYAGYYRVMAVPLLGFALAWRWVGRLWSPEAPRARWGNRIVLAGLALAFAGTALEFWGSWLLDEEISYEAAEGEGWWGSNAGWGLFLFGFLLLLVGGPTAAVALRRRRLPFWVLALVTLLGFGIFAGNGFHEAPLPWALLGLGVFAAGWIALGVLLWRRPYAFSSTPT